MRGQLSVTFLFILLKSRLLAASLRMCGSAVGLAVQSYEGLIHKDHRPGLNRQRCIIQPVVASNIAANQ